jgi:hypothetical protein
VRDIFNKTKIITPEIAEDVRAKLASLDAAED